jgi:hypothetical protein
MIALFYNNITVSHPGGNGGQYVNLAITDV